MDRKRFTNHSHCPDTGRNAHSGECYCHTIDIDSQQISWQVQPKKTPAFLHPIHHVINRYPVVVHCRIILHSSARCGSDGIEIAIRYSRCSVALRSVNTRSQEIKFRVEMPCVSGFYY